MAVGELLPQIREGTIGTEAIIVDFVAAGVIPMWAPVILVAKGAGEDLARVNVTTTANSTAVIGVVVGPILPSGNAADMAGQSVYVCIFGRCKVRVNAALAVATLVATSATSGRAGAITAAVGALLGKLLDASGADGDIVPLMVCLG